MIKKWIKSILVSILHLILINLTLMKISHPLHVTDLKVRPTFNFGISEFSTKIQSQISLLKYRRSNGCLLTRHFSGKFKKCQEKGVITYVLIIGGREED